MMNVVHISYSDNMGGAAIAAYRHHEAMLNAGINSSMLLASQPKQPNPNIDSYNKVWMDFLFRCFNKTANIINNPYGAWSCNFWGYNFPSCKQISDADIIILHWINYNAVSFNGLMKLLKMGKPVYWFLHDMWPLTGGCHYAFDCDKYKTECRRCAMFRQRLGSRIDKDLSYYQFKAKSILSQYSNLRFIVPSKWLASCVKESALFKCHQVNVIPNTLNTDLLVIRDKMQARRNLGLPQDKKLVLFGAENINSPYKGWKYLKKALTRDLLNTECVVYGNSNKDAFRDIDIVIHDMGRIDNIDRLIDLYNACDAFVTPSLADNYPNVIVESMACGLPCVGFNTGGIPDLIDHKKTGYLTERHDSEELSAGIKWILDNPTKLSTTCRSKIENNCSYKTVANKWLDIICK